MLRPRTTLGITLLAAVLAGPLVRTGPNGAAAQAVRSTDFSSSAVHYVLPTARSQPALNPRSPVDRAGGGPSPALVPGAASSFAGTRSPMAPPPRQTRPRPGSPLQFPLFPTGPPLDR